jgi:hypothetical protein
MKYDIRHMRFKVLIFAKMSVFVWVVTSCEFVVAAQNMNNCEISGSHGGECELQLYGI